MALTIIEVIAVIAFLVLLGAAVFMLVNFYVCDNYNCKIYIDADERYERGSREYIVYILTHIFADGIWPIPFIGAAILTPLVLWFVKGCIFIRDFAIAFIVSIFVIYFLFAFYGHHYINFVAGYVADYIINLPPEVPPATPLNDNDDIEPFNINGNTNNKPQKEDGIEESHVLKENDRIEESHKLKEDNNICNNTDTNTNKS